MGQGGERVSKYAVMLLEGVLFCLIFYPGRGLFWGRRGPTYVKMSNSMDSADKMSKYQ